MTERAQLERLANAGGNALAAMSLAYEELFFGGNWVIARERLKTAGLALEKAIEAAERTLGPRGSEHIRLSFSGMLAMIDQDKPLPKSESQ